MWQALRDELHPQGFELVTVGLDSLGAAGCAQFIEAAAPKHPSLIDQHHTVAEKFGVINIPSSIWIDEAGMIVRPAEPAPAPPPAVATGSAEEKDGAEAAEGFAPDLTGMPDRFVKMMTEAAKIPSNPGAYHAALKDWVAKGAASEFAMSTEQVIARSRPRDADVALGHAHFEIGSALAAADKEADAIPHFRRAHELVPDSWTFRRQAWSLRPVGDGPFARFWQGPNPESPNDWPYDGGWLEDVQKAGAENYNAPWQP